MKHTEIQSLVSQMTIEEKAALCTGATAWTTTPVQRLGIPAMTVSDGPHGVRRVPDVTALMQDSLPATCFPTAASLASTWDVGLIEQMGAALAEECIALNVDVVLGPGANIKRTPLNGRNFEYFSEDPYLAGEMAVAHITGVQRHGVGTSLKHFAGNNQEYQRLSINAEIDERALREIYLPAFEKAVKKARPFTVMCAYNKLNGEFCSQHYRLLTEILKNEWGFEGLVVSDWGAVHDRVAGLQAGLDLEMPGPKAQRVQSVIDAVRKGTLKEAALDESVRRILNIVYKTAETPKVASGGSFDVEAHHALARRIAGEGIVLLRNNGILPLKNPQHIAVIGHAAQVAHFQGGGSSHINATRVDVPYVELQKLAGEAELTYAPGYPADDTSQPALVDEAVAIAKAADVALLYIALPAYKESEGYDRADIDVTRQQAMLIKAVAAVQPKTVVILNNGAALAMNEWIDDVSAVLEAWMMGQAGGGAIADVLFGRVNPSGKLAETYPLRLSDTPAFINYPGELGTVRYGEGLFVGYRYYDAKGVPVLFPFGFGLSYTTSAYSNPKVSATTFKDNEGVTVSVDVTNTGKVTGKEVVQVYVSDRKAKLVRPVKELKGFAKVELQPGETKTVSFALDFRAFAYYHPAYRQWVAESGEFDLLMGSSSADIRCTQTVTLQSTQQLPSILNRESTMREWQDDLRGKVVVAPVLLKMKELSRKTFGGGEAEASSAAMDMSVFMLDMPLVGTLEWMEQGFGEPALTIVDRLLAQVRTS
jgi:beta-glucosidase